MKSGNTSTPPSHTGAPRLYPAAKRLVDIAASCLGIALLTPLLLPLILLLRCTGEGEIFYRQRRIGQGNIEFGIWKFATMLKNSPNIGTGSLTLRNDPRVTTVGKFLRITKINELPQLINVAVGQMSLIGPRPQMRIDFDVYPTHVREQIYAIAPGISGIGSIIFRDEERLLSQAGVDPKAYYAKHIAPYKGELELWYQRRQSLAVDVILLLLTVWVIIVPHSDLPLRVWKDLPPVPDTLKELMIKGSV